MAETELILSEGKRALKGSFIVILIWIFLDLGSFKEALDILRLQELLDLEKKVEGLEENIKQNKDTIMCMKMLEQKEEEIEKLKGKASLTTLTKYLQTLFSKIQEPSQFQKGKNFSKKKAKGWKC